MKKISRLFLFGALALILLTAGCAGEEGQEGTPGSLETLPPGDSTSYPSPIETMPTEATESVVTETAVATETAESTATTLAAATQQTPVLPVTGDEVILLECQFCVDTFAHALLVMPDTATFEIVTSSASISTTDPDMGCNMVDTFNGRQVVLCRAQENTSLTLNICTDANTCSQLSVALQACPVAATSTPRPGAGATATATPAAGEGTATATATGVASPTTSVLPTTTPTP